MRRSSHRDKARKESAYASDRRRDRLVFVDSMNRFFGEKNLSPVSKEKDTVILQTCQRYLEYVKRNPIRPAA